VAPVVTALSERSVRLVTGRNLGREAGQPDLVMPSGTKLENPVEHKLDRRSWHCGTLPERASEYGCLHVAVAPSAS
jgi:hypothetical protein